MSPGEAIYDISRVVSGYVDVIVVRHPERGAVSEFARATNVPVINGGDGPGEHPSQALLDLYTIEQEFARLGKRIDGSRVALVGDLKNGRTVHSLLKLLAMYRNLSISLVSPHGLEMPATIVDAVDSTGSTVQVGNSLSDGLALADIVYATRVDRGQISTESLEGEQPEFRITRSMVDMFCKPETIVMHPLPRDSRPLANDLAMDLNADPRLAIFRQTDNGIPIRMAIFAVLLGVDEQIARSIRDATWRRPAYIGPDDASFSRL